MKAKKYIVIGSPGSGKSVLSRKLAQITGLRLIHLDLLYWKPDGTTVEREVFDRRLGEALDGDGWIIDGNYQRTMERRIAACDAVIFLDYPTDVCLRGITERIGQPHSDLPWVEAKADAELEATVRSFQTKNRPIILQLLEKYADKQIVPLTSREEGECFLEQLQKEYGDRKKPTR